METVRIRDPRWKKVGSRIRNTDLENVLLQSGQVKTGPAWWPARWSNRFFSRLKVDAHSPQRNRRSNRWPWRKNTKFPHWQKYSFLGPRVCHCFIRLGVALIWHAGRLDSERWRIQVEVIYLRGFCHFPRREVDAEQHGSKTTEYMSTDSPLPLY
jgi:hypothetical protein